jgi:hypothetical protein
MLVILLRRPGEIVTREELREQLWPADTFVDFDHTLGDLAWRSTTQPLELATRGTKSSPDKNARTLPACCPQEQLTPVSAKN